MWRGDLPSGGPVARTTLARAHPVPIGFGGAYDVISPSPRVGSLAEPRAAHVTTDRPNAEKKPENPGPRSLLYRLEW